MLTKLQNRATAWAVRTVLSRGGSYGRIGNAIVDAAGYTYADLSKVANQAKAYTESPWVYVAAGKISSTAAQASLDVMELVDETETEAVNHPIEQLFRKPNSYQSQFELKQAIYAFYKITGNAFIYMESDTGGAPTALHLLRPDRIQIVPGRDTSSMVKAYVYTVGGTEIPLPAESVIHWKNFNPVSDYYGLSEVQIAMLSIQTDKGMAEWNRNYFGKEKAIPAGFVNIGGFISDPDYERIKNDWQRNYGGTSRAIAFIRGEDVKFTALNQSHQEMDFLSGRQAERNLIFDVMGLPPGMIDPNATEANAMAAMQTFQRDTIYPLTVAFCQKLTAELAPLYGDNLVIEAQDNRIQDGVKERAEMQAAAAFLSINEIRKKYFLFDPVPWGDVPAVGAAAGGPVGGLPNMDRHMSAEQHQVIAQDAQEEAAAPDNAGGDQATAEQPMKLLPAPIADLTVPRLYISKQIRKEVAQFGRYVHNHPDDYSAFKFLHIPGALSLSLLALADSVDEHEIEALTNERATKAEGRYSISGKPDPNSTAKDHAEQAVKDKTAAFLQSIADLVAKTVKHAATQARKASNIPGDLSDYEEFFDDSFWATIYEMSNSHLRGVLQDAVERGSIDAAKLLEAKLGIGFDPAIFNPKAARFAMGWTDGILKKFNTTTRDGVGALLARWIGTEGATIGDLVSAIQESHLFSEERAALVATTEVTRAFAVGETMAGQEIAKLANVDYRAADSGLQPPLHPNCRCWIDTVPVYEGDTLIAFDAQYNTSRDSYVCPICQPYNGQYIGAVSEASA